MKFIFGKINMKGKLWENLQLLQNGVSILLVKLMQKQRKWKMNNSIFYNSETLNILKKYSEKKMEYLIKGIHKEPYELMKEINNAETK